MADETPSLPHAYHVGARCLPVRPPWHARTCDDFAGTERCWTTSVPDHLSIVPDSEGSVPLVVDLHGYVPPVWLSRNHVCVCVCWGGMRRCVVTRVPVS